MNLTAHQQSILTTALELEATGYHSAAEYLRTKHFPTINWLELITTHVDWTEVFRRHSEHAAKGGAQ